MSEIREQLNRIESKVDRLMQELNRLVGRLEGVCEGLEGVKVMRGGEGKSDMGMDREIEPSWPFYGPFNPEKSEWYRRLIEGEEIGGAGR